MLMPRNMGLGQTCPGGGAWDSGLNVCCAPVGTPPMQDPCSILNNPAFIAQQNQQIAQDVASIPASSYEGQTLAALVAVPINIGQDAVHCQSNPGATFIDSMGVTVTCPSPSHSDLTTGGQPMSTYSTAQLAAMLNSQYGGKAAVSPGNAVYSAPTSTVQPTQQELQTVAPALPGGSTSGGSTSGSTNGSSESGGSTGSTGSSSLTSSAGIDLSFLTNSTLITGIPNWMVGLGGLAALLILPGLIGGRKWA